MKGGKHGQKAKLRREDVTSVDFFYDPLCPFAFAASLWIREVARSSSFQLDFRFFSLEEVNLEAGKRHPWERDWSYGFSLMKLAWLIKQQDPSLADRFYLEVGSAIHLHGEQIHTPEHAAHFVEAVGLDRSLVQKSMRSKKAEEAVRADHVFLVERFGGFGVPTLVLNDSIPVFGPVVMPAPTKNQAVELFDTVLAFASMPNLFELKRPRDKQANLDLARELAPYLKGRVWRSV